MFPAAARANRSIFYDRQGNARTIAGVQNELVRRYQVAKARSASLIATAGLPATPPAPPAASSVAPPTAPVRTGVSGVPDTAGVTQAIAAAQTPRAPRILCRARRSRFIRCSRTRSGGVRSFHWSPTCGQARAPRPGWRRSSPPPVRRSICSRTRRRPRAGCSRAGLERSSLPVRPRASGDPVLPPGSLAWAPAFAGANGESAHIFNCQTAQTKSAPVLVRARGFARSPFCFPSPNEGNGAPKRRVIWITRRSSRIAPG